MRMQWPVNASNVSSRKKSGWLVLVFHGLDGEGWGTLSSDALARMLDDIDRAGIVVETPNRTLQQHLSTR